MKDLLSSSTVGQMNVNLLKKPEISYLLVDDKLKTFPQHKDVPSHASWGWKRKEDESCIPVWTTLSEASRSCKELIKCS